MTAFDQIRSRGHQKGIRISSIHPMFGPDVISLEDRNIIICRTSTSAEINVEIANLFNDTAVNLIFSHLEQHDFYISYTLGLSHLVNLLVGSVLESSEFTFSDILKFAGTTFMKQITTTREVFSENPTLYHAI